MWHRTIYRVAAKCKEQPAVSTLNNHTDNSVCSSQTMVPTYTVSHPRRPTYHREYLTCYQINVSYCDRKILQGRSVCDRQNKAQNYGLRSLQRTFKPLHDISLWEQGYKLLYNCKVFCEGSASLKTLGLRGLIFRKFRNAYRRNNAKCWCFENLSWKMVLP
jgi:hypothetical protein